MTEPQDPAPAKRPLVPITITTRKPEKWHFLDLETNETWWWKDGHFVLLPPHPQADYAGAWQTLVGYVQQARDDGAAIDPAELLGLLAELRRTALEPVAEWMKSLGAE